MKIKDRIVHYLCSEVIWIIYDYENTFKRRLNIGGKWQIACFCVLCRGLCGVWFYFGC